MTKLKTIANMYEKFDADFKEVLRTRSESICLLKLLTTPATELPSIIWELMECYDKKGVFNIGGHEIGITLEDILYLTGLPIRGQPVICKVSRDNDAFNRVLDLPSRKRYTICSLIKRATNKDLNQEVRIKLILLVLIHCYICPTNDGFVSRTYVHLVADLESVNNYAWGAALLAFLIASLDNDKKISVDGNIWVLMGFFLVRIPKLRNVIHMEWGADFGLPLLPHITAKIRITHSQAENKIFKQTVNHVISNIVDEDIIWTPYTAYQSTSYFDQNKKFGTLIAPIFCHNFFAIHMPHKFQR